MNERDLDTHRNRWVVEKREFIEARQAAAEVVRNPDISPRSAVKQHPELAGTYLNLRAAEIAARSMRNHEDQKKFVALIRNAMADSIARGEPLQPVRVRERGAREPAPGRTAREPDLAPARS